MVVVLALAALAFSLTVANVTSHAAPLRPAAAATLPHLPHAGAWPAIVATAASTVAWTVGGGR